MQIFPRFMKQAALQQHFCKVEHIPAIGRFQLNAFTTQGQRYLIPFFFFKIDAAKQVHRPVVKFIKTQCPLQGSHGLSIVMESMVCFTEIIMHPAGAMIFDCFSSARG